MDKNFSVQLRDVAKYTLGRTTSNSTSIKNTKWRMQKQDDLCALCVIHHTIMQHLWLYTLKENITRN